MGLVDDIIERISEIVGSVGDTILESGTELLTKILVSGATAVFSYPTIELAKFYNDQVGYVDPLLLPPLLCYPVNLDDFVLSGSLECEYTDLVVGPPLSGLACTTSDTFEVGELDGLETITGGLFYVHFTP